MMAFLRPIFLVFYIILVSNVTLYHVGADNNETLMEESTCRALQESYRYSVTEENANFSEELRDERISVVESPLQNTLKKCYIEPRNSESLKKLLSPTCAPNEEE